METTDVVEKWAQRVATGELEYDRILHVDADGEMQDLTGEIQARSVEIIREAW